MVWYYRFRHGNWMAAGVHQYDTEAQFRAALRRAWRVNRLPAGLKVRGVR